MVKSVTTVAKLIGSISPFRILLLRTRMGICCISGCTEMTRSGSYLANLHGTVLVCAVAVLARESASNPDVLLGEEMEYA